MGAGVVAGYDPATSRERRRAAARFIRRRRTEGRSEHILLGVVREQQGVGARVLGAHGITDDRLGTRLGETPWIGRMVAGRSLAVTARAQRALELAVVEAGAHGSEMISTHDVLLGLLGVIDGGGFCPMKCVWSW